eukprot:c6392_g1_i1 orf=262-1131(+)
MSTIRNSSVALCVFGLLVALTNLHRSCAILHKVGNAYGWTHEIADYGEWASTKHFEVGDSLLFSYDPKIHSVVQVSREDYETCHNEMPLYTHEDGNLVVNLTHECTYYFISGSRRHCLNGMKLGLRALASTTGPTPTSTASTSAPSPASPSPAPTTTSPSISPIITAPTPSPKTSAPAPSPPTTIPAPPSINAPAPILVPTPTSVTSPTPAVSSPVMPPTPSPATVPGSATPNPASTPSPSSALTPEPAAPPAPTGPASGPATSIAAGTDLVTLAMLRAAIMSVVIVVL